MKYYDGHEHVYRKLEAEGHSCWDRKPFDDFEMRPFLERALARIGPPAPGARSLEIGCGTGPISCLLAARGYDALGLDISATAVRMATRHAEERGLRARFEVRDVVDLDGHDAYGLIVDGHCLHCIVYDAERARLLASLHRLLAPGGALVVETMARHPDVRMAPRFLLDDDGILWLDFPQGNPEDLKRIGEKLYHPNRRILTCEALRAELLRAGFVLEYEHEERQVKEEPWLYQAIARKV